MKTARIVVVGTVLGIAALAAAAGCSGPGHMTRAHGRAYGAYFQRQAASAGAHAQAEKGLDSEEAAIVADAYRKSLAPKGTREDEGSQVLLVAPPPRGGQRAAPLAPSVPKE